MSSDTYVRRKGKQTNHEISPSDEQGSEHHGKNDKCHRLCNNCPSLHDDLRNRLHTLLEDGKRTQCIFCLRFGTRRQTMMKTRCKCFWYVLGHFRAMCAKVCTDMTQKAADLSCLSRKDVSEVLHSLLLSKVVTLHF